MKEFSFYFDYLSPFSYFAWHRMRRMTEFADVKIHSKPVALGSLLNFWGIKGPGEVEPKRIFLLKQMLRYADQEKIPFTTPKTHPFNSLYALRLSLSSVAGASQAAVIEALWCAGWQERCDLGEPDELIAILRGRGLPAEDLFERSFSREAKQELKANIQEALSAGAFGVPSFVVGDELFWGNDSVPELVAFLQGRDQLDRQKLSDLLASTPRAAAQQIP
jgi:2-hydroxychromene-2-carboxylate isomerase